jgi:rhodanese-related sulfurtransferase
MEKNERKNILILGAGILLIIFFALFSFLKPRLEKTPAKETNLAEMEYIQSVKKAQKITSEELQKKILAKEPVVIIDIRTEKEYQMEHILDAINLPSANLAEAVTALELEKTYILVDDGTTLQAAYAAGKIFAEKNFTNVFYLSGGFVAWKNKINMNISFGNPTSFVDQSKVVYINSAELKDIIDKEKNIFILDLRPAEQFKGGHLKGAVNIPLEKLETQRRSIPFGKKIILYGESDLTAFQGAVRMNDIGFLNVLTLTDNNPNDWKEKGLEIITE